MFRLTLSALLLVTVLGLASGCRDRDGSDNDSQRPADATRAAAVTGATAEAASPTPETPATARPPFPKPGASAGEITVGGRTRTYRQFLPSAVSSGTPLPLVIGLHGGLGTGAQFAQASDFETLAERERFIAVFPDGVGRTWNGGRCCGQAAREQLDDVAYLASLIDHLAAAVPVDRARVFMTGHSNGGIMAWRFACERPDLVTAVAPVAGSLEVSRCASPRGTSLLVIHGDADQSHPLEGGEGPRSIAGVAFTSVAASLAIWTSSMGCSAQVETRSEGALTTSTWSGCRDGSRTRLVVIAGADHPWPGSRVIRLSDLQGEASQALDATAAAWAFFAETPGR